jgi:hypothetical protein
MTRTSRGGYYGIHGYVYEPYDTYPIFRALYEIFFVEDGILRVMHRITLKLEREYRSPIVLPQNDGQFKDGRDGTTSDLKTYVKNETVINLGTTDEQTVQRWVWLYDHSWYQLYVHTDVMKIIDEDILPQCIIPSDDLDTAKSHLLDNIDLVSKTFPNILNVLREYIQGLYGPSKYLEYMDVSEISWNTDVVLKKSYDQLIKTRFAHQFIEYIVRMNDDSLTPEEMQSLKIPKHNNEKNFLGLRRRHKLNSAAKSFNEIDQLINQQDDDDVADAFTIISLLACALFLMDPQYYHQIQSVYVVLRTLYEGGGSNQLRFAMEENTKFFKQNEMLVSLLLRMHIPSINRRVVIQPMMDAATDNPLLMNKVMLSMDAFYAKGAQQKIPYRRIMGTNVADKSDKPLTPELINYAVVWLPPDEKPSFKTYSPPVQDVKQALTLLKQESESIEWRYPGY